MVEVEGEDYRNFKTIQSFGFCSFDAFLEEWEKNYLLLKQSNLGSSARCIDIGGNHAIYGKRGWNRYLVLEDGEIIFLEYFSCPEDTKKAKRAGFRFEW